MHVRFVTAALALLSALTLSAAAQTKTPDAEGYIRDWLVLAPYPLGDVNGFVAIDEKPLADEAQPKLATPGARQRVGDFELVWIPIATPEFFIDFRDLFPIEGDRGVAWAVAYVTSPTAKSDLTLKMNSNDQGKAYLNGQEVVKFSDARGFVKEDENPAPNLSLKAGVNVVVLKVVNESGNWQGSIRFVDKAGKPVTDLKIATQP